jgi:SAM-dependent methyltransferase
MIEHSRWAVAQAGEKKHWIKNRHRYVSDAFKTKLRLKAEQNERWISQFIELRGDSQIMEIGGAAEPIIDFFSQGRLTSLDPLNDFYLEQFPGLVNPKVRRVKATAEDIPFTDHFFDLIMIHNVLDHTRNPSLVTGELSRCLKADGILDLSVDTFPLFWVWGRKLLPLLGGRDHLLHPHSFSVGKVLGLLRDGGFKIVEAKLDLFIPGKREENGTGRTRQSVYRLLNYRRQRLSISARKSDQS